MFTHLNHILSRILKLIGVIHKMLVFDRRTDTLAFLFVKLIPDNSSVLDVGCGDGLIDIKILKQAPGLKILGIDIVRRKNALIPVKTYNGHHIPYLDNSFDVVMFIDVLHHTDNPEILLLEAKRVAKKYIIIKDHTANTTLSRVILKIMDWIGNRPHDIKLTYNYLSWVSWQNLWKSLNLKVSYQNQKIKLYPFPFSIIFADNKHFVVKLTK